MITGRRGFLKMVGGAVAGLFAPTLMVMEPPAPSRVILGWDLASNPGDFSAVVAVTVEPDGVFRVLDVTTWR